MKMKFTPLTLGCALFALAAHGQTFNSGSDGSNGPLSVTAASPTETVIELPPSGILNYTTVNIATGKTLRFKRNAANTPVYLLASGNVTISGTIEISGLAGSPVAGGLGGPGGFDGGSPGSVGVPPGAGQGPGAGKGGAANSNAPDGAGSGAFSTVHNLGASANKGAPYGNSLLVPLVGGSGGGGTAGTPGGGGSGGGGAILITSSTRIDLTGRIHALGAGNNGGAYNAASGGGVRLVAPIIIGGGTIDVRSNGNGGLGRIRIDATDRSGMSFNFSDSSVTSVGSLMLVFPNPQPRLDIIEAASMTIPEGSGPVILQLPFGSSPNRKIKVQARDFNAEVPITVVLTPDHGTPLSYAAKINNAASNPASVTVDVVLPVNEQTTVHVYSK